MRNDLLNQTNEYFGESDILKQTYRSAPSFDKPLNSKIEELLTNCDHFLSKTLKKHGEDVPDHLKDVGTVNIAGEEYHNRNSTREPTRISVSPSKQNGRQRSVSKNIASDLSEFRNTEKYSVALRDSQKKSEMPQKSSESKPKKEKGINRNEALEKLRLNERNYVQQLGDKAINSYFVP